VAVAVAVTLVWVVAPDQVVLAVVAPVEQVRLWLAHLVLPTRAVVAALVAEHSQLTLWLAQAAPASSSSSTPYPYSQS